MKTLSKSCRQVGSDPEQPPLITGQSANNGKGAEQSRVVAVPEQAIPEGALTLKNASPRKGTPGRQARVRGGGGWGRS